MDPTYWTYISVVTATVLVGGFAFRQGRLRRMTRVYRNVAAPAVLRNLAIASPVLAALAIPLIAAMAPIAWNLTLPQLPERLTRAYPFGVLAYLLLYVGLVITILSRPPRWLFPAWLQDEDDRLAYRPPRFDWFDRLMLALGLLFLAGGAVAAAVAVTKALK